jgi:hypothetical protein
MESHRRGEMPKKKAAKRSPPKRASASLTLAARTAALAQTRNASKGADALALVERRLQTIAESFYDIAIALQTLNRKDVYSSLGCSSFVELVETRTGISRALAFELLKIPGHFSREAAVALGREKAVALIRYVDATPEVDDAERLAREDAFVGGKAVSSQSAAAIELAASKTRKRKRGRKKIEGEDEAATAAVELERALESRSSADVHVVTLRRRDGWWIKIETPVALAGVLAPSHAKGARSTKKAAKKPPTRRRKR